MLYRRLIYLFFILLFLVSAPLIVLYTQGYRYNFQRNQIQKTGILVISSTPKKARIFLNSKLQTVDTPAKIEKVLPGDYEITIAKEGYHDWIKRLPVYENGTTFAEKILLWKKSSPVAMTTSTPSAWLVSPDNDRAAMITNDNQLIILSLGNGGVDKSQSLAIYKDIQPLMWSDSNRKLIILAQKNGQDMALIFDTEPNWPIPSAQGRSQEKLLPSNNVKWDLKNDNYIYSLNNAGLAQTDLFRKKQAIIFNTTSTKDFIIMGNSVYLYNGQTIYQTNASGQGTPSKITAIACAGCKFLNKIGNRLILMDSETQKLFIIDPKNKNKIIAATAKNFLWLNDSVALYYNDFEIWLYDTNKQEPELITRFGDPISGAVWHPLGKDIIFNTKNSIRIIELDNRELRNIIELASGEDINNLAINHNGDYLYYMAGAAETQRIYKLNIK